MRERTRRPSPAVPKIAPKKEPSTSVSQAPPIVHDVLRSAGQPLDAATRAFMEPRFGQDFSHVRVHTDDRAAASASAVSAVAYTVGQDVVFASGKYAPHGTEGRQLLAHELTHVVQQAHDAHGASSSPSAAEAEADRIGAHIAGVAAPAQTQASMRPPGSRVAIRTGGHVLQRQGDKNPLDETAKKIIAAAKDDKVALATRAVALVNAILDTYYAGEKDKVDGVEYDDKKAGTGLMTQSVGSGATAKGKIHVGDYFTQNVDAFARRVLQVGHELMHIDQYRGGMAGGQNKDKREFLAFHANALATEKPGTGRMSFSTRLALIDAALGYYYCLSAEDQKSFETKKAELQTKRKEVDGKAGNDPVPEPTACKRQG